MRKYWFSVWSALGIFLALGVRLQAEFAYVVTDDSSILGYRINPNSGTLTAIAGSPFAGGKRSEFGDGGSEGQVRLCGEFG